jgi:hypothetical protein
MDILLFMFARLLTKTFWLLVAVTFVGVIMMAARTSYRDSIFKAAAETVGKRYGNFIR